MGRRYTRRGNAHDANVEETTRKRDYMREDYKGKGLHEKSTTRGED